jgi:predicted nucleic acid-binding protein
MKYVDSMLFVYAVTEQGPRSIHAQNLLEKIQEGDLPAVTSALTFDEVFYKVKQVGGHDNAVKSGEAFLELPNLRFIPVDGAILWKTRILLDEHTVNPRDAIHAACALDRGVYTVISEDDDFETFPELEREWPLPEPAIGDGEKEDST